MGVEKIMLTQKDQLSWHILVSIDNNESPIHTLALIKKVKEFYPEVDDIEIKKLMYDLKEYIYLEPFGWILTRSGVEFLKQHQTQMDLYFNPHFEDGHVVWIDLLHYLVDTKTDITEKMLCEIQEKVINVIEKYRKD